MSSGGGTNTVQSNSGPPADVLAHYNDVYNQAKNVASQPNQQYNGSLIAGFTPFQQSGFDNLGTAINAGQPFINQASQDITNAATSLSPENFGATTAAYQSPYTQRVVDATQAQFNNQNAIQQNQIKGNAAQAGAFGGDRQGVAQGVAAGQEALAQAPVIAGLYNTGFQNATNAAQSNAWLNSQAGFGLANLGNEAQQQGLTAVNAELGAGGVQQQLAQQELNVPYQAFLAAQGYPYQTTNWLEGMATGTGGLSGTQGSTTSPGPSTASQIAGLGTALVGGLGATGAFGSGGWLSNGLSNAFNVGGASAADLATVNSLAAAPIGSTAAQSVAGTFTGQRGGRVNGLAAGGSIPDLSIGVIPETGGAKSSGLLGGTNNLLGGGGNLLGSSTGTTSTTNDPNHDSTIGSLIKLGGQIAASVYGGPAAGLAVGALNTQVHFDEGGAVAPGLSASVGGNPMLAQAAQSYNGLPTEKLQELAARFPPNSPQGSLVQRALQTRHANPGSNPVQAGLDSMLPAYARGGEAEDDDALPDLVIPQVGPSVPGGLAAGFAPVAAGVSAAPAPQHTGHVPSSLLDAVSTAVHLNESGGRMAPGIIGDNGKSAGVMQVQQPVIDRVNQRLGTNYSFNDLVQNPAVGKLVGETHLAELLSKYHDPAYAMGAYNAGEGAMDRALRTGAGVSGLPHSTQGYIARGLRALQSMQGAARGGAIHLADGGIASDAANPDAYGDTSPTTSVSPDWTSPAAMAARNKGLAPPVAGLTPVVPGTPGDAGSDDPIPPMPPADVGSGSDIAGGARPQSGLGAMKEGTQTIKADPWEAVLAAGLGMMAGTSPHALTNIGSGGLAGLKSYQQQKQLAIQDQMRSDAEKTNAVWRAGQLGNLQDKTRLAQAVADTRAPLIAAQTDAAQARTAALEAGKPKFQYVATTAPDPDDPTKTISGFSKIDISGKADPQFIRTDTNPNKPAVTGGLNGREGVFLQRVAAAGNEAAQSIKNIMELPTSASTGWFGQNTPGPGLLSSVKSVLANHLTSQGVQDYKSMVAGVNRNLATIESAGLAPPGSLTHGMDTLSLSEGDTELTKMRKLAEMRQIVEKGLEPNLANPRIPAEQKDMLKGIIKQVQDTVPFTHHDITQFQASKNPNLTMEGFMKSKGLGDQTQPAPTSAGKAGAAPAMDWKSAPDGTPIRQGGVTYIKRGNDPAQWATAP